MRPSPSTSVRKISRLARSRYDATRSPTTVQKAIEAAYYRGGTSRAVVFQPRHLPKERARWPDLFRQVMGSGDSYGRQLDGMGAGISSLSKICLVEPYGKPFVKPKQDRPSQASKQVETEEPVDIDYTFIGLGIELNEVDVAGNCGNMSSAIGPYAYNARLLPKRFYYQKGGQITVKIRNTNTGKLIDATFKVTRGQAAVVGDYTIDGVSGQGSKIKLDYKHPYGSKTGKVLPTGNIIDKIGGYEVSCVDGANPAVFIRADDVGVDGTILPNDFNKLPEKLDLLEQIRKKAAVAMGIVSSEDATPRVIPKLGLVSKSSSHSVLSGQTLEASETDLVVRFLSDMQPHRAIPLTAALTTAVAARIPGTIVEQALAANPVMEDAITIGHASGRLQVNAVMDEQDPTIPVCATVYRTAKRLFAGKTYWVDRGAKESGMESTVNDESGQSLGLAFVNERRCQV